MRNTAYHQQAQYITQQVLNVVQSNREQIFQEVKATEDNILRALKLNHLNELDSIAKQTVETKAPSTLTPDPAINVTTSDTIQAQMLTILERIDKKLDQAPQGPPQRCTRRTYTRTDTSKYCWSHGACAHTGKKCRNPKQGHQAEATFANKMGGSTLYCTPVKE